MNDTIVAIATSMASPSGINIIRISGEDALSAVKTIFTAKDFVDIIPNKMYLGKIISEKFIEKAFCVYYKAPKSYTGEDVAEIHCHGGKIITEVILRAVCNLGIRPAHAGEFTKRAFLNNKLSLDEAEGIFGIINAASESDLKNSCRLMEGELGKGLNESENLLISATALLEVALDYPEEIEEDNSILAKENLLKVKNNIEKLLQTQKYARFLREGAHVAIIGRPNSGKSSLLNAILRQERAIVSDIPGTTRDVLNESVEIEGIKINFVDTAGIRNSDNLIEGMGIERAKKAIEYADIVIYLQDTTIPSNEEEKEIERLLLNKKVIYAANKTDIGTYERQGIKISAKYRINIDELINKIMSLIDKEAIVSQTVITSERHIFALREALKNIDEAINSFSIAPIECVLVDIKSALSEIGRITGKEISESVVEEIFSKFCVGK